MLIISSLILFYSSQFMFAYHCNHTALHDFDPYGVGVVAQRDFLKGEIIESPLAITIPQRFIKKTILFQYTLSRQRANSEVVFGFGALYNHNDNTSIGIYFENASYHVKAERNIASGEEIFFSYGRDWFRNRNITPRKPGLIKVNLPGCPYSITERSGHTLKATQHISQGEVIEVARALILPAIRVMGTSLDQFVWYREVSNLGAMVVLGNGPFYLPAIDPVLANVQYGWYHDPNIEEGPLTCSEHMLVAFVAIRDIFPGDTITVPLIVDPLSPSKGFRRRVVDMLLPLHCF